MSKDLVIPIDDAIEDFKNHLLSHPRTILSAQFGDGKTFFVDKFMKSTRIKQKFLCLRIFPVNYQVLDNKDIFELVKRDILLQLIYHNMVPEDYEISKELALAFLIRNNGVGLVEDLLTSAAMCETGDSQSRVICSFVSRSVSLLKKFDKQFKALKSQDYANAILNYIEASNKNFLLEEDIITVIIRDCIDKYRKKHRSRRIVLFFEDMDRIDPAQLFRILNVLSAQMDYVYKYGVRPNVDARKMNKFGVDNIVLVMDYSNLRSIFTHFYGEGASFNGYIHKFTSSTYYTYSLKQQQYHYMIQQIAVDTGFRDLMLERIFPEDMFDKYSLRDLDLAIQDTESQIKEKVVWKNINQTIPLSLGPLKLLVVLRRLGFSDDNIKEYYRRAIKEISMEYLVWVGGYYLQMRKSSGMEYFKLLDDNKITHKIFIEGMQDDGRAILKERGRLSGYYKNDDEDNLWEYLIGLIAK